MTPIRRCVYTLDMETKSIYVMGIDFTNGRTPSYQRHHAWKCADEATARRYFALNAIDATGHRAALIAADGRIVTTFND